ncbi:MAG: heme b synthase [Syntrophales bacterium]
MPDSGPRTLDSRLAMVAWEVTRSCNLACIHCRASSLRGPYHGELGTARCLELVDEIASVGKPVIILTGGEPLLREDIFEIAGRGTAKGLRMVLATNGTLVTEDVTRRMTDSGIKRVSISIDGADAVSHDEFRRVPGAFAGAMAGIEALKKAGMEFQINTTVTKTNLGQVRKILALAVGLGAAAYHIFLLVPTGRGREMADQEISPEEYEKILGWLYEQSSRCPIQLKATCAPHYFRILHQKGRGARNPEANHPLHAMTRGCLGGSSFCFISHTGQVQPCGYLEVDCGQIMKNRFNDIWMRSPVFKSLRDLNQYRGKCGRCEYIRVCGGCRARAYEATGDYLEEEPLCVWEPRHRASGARRQP